MRFHAVGLGSIDRQLCTKASPWGMLEAELDALRARAHLKFAAGTGLALRMPVVRVDREGESG